MGEGLLAKAEAELKSAMQKAARQAAEYICPAQFPHKVVTTQLQQARYIKEHPDWQALNHPNYLPNLVDVYDAVMQNTNTDMLQEWLSLDNTPCERGTIQLPGSVAAHGQGRGAKSEGD